MKNKIYQLVKKQGFIIFLFVCVCAVAGTTLYLSMRSLDVVEDDTQDNELIILNEKDKENLSLVNKEKETKEVASMEEAKDSEDTVCQDDEISQDDNPFEKEDIVEASNIEEVDELEFEEDDLEKEEVSYLIEEARTAILPLDGEVITEYTEDSLIYSETLEAWVGHGAIDIKGAEGAPILAAMDGKIKEVYKDDLWGIVITIDHGDGLETRYSNLASMEMVKEGISVKKGDHISKLGKTAKIEMHMESHLHFEVRKNGKIVDPRSIIK